MTTAKLVWQPRSHDPHLQIWLHRIDVPTLLIWGEHDRLFPKDYAFAYQKLIPESKAVIIPDCGHLPEVEKADVFAAELKSFIGAMRIAA
jgi:pimeloyl-ACP methyl ester carboxylesterase